MKSKTKLLATFGLGALTALAVVFTVRARAAGIPELDGMTYTGYLEDGDGAPLTGDRAVQVSFFDAIDATEEVCDGSNAGNTMLQSGRFQVQLPKECTDAVKASPDIWVEVEVDGSALPRTKLGAVPYAVEAGHAETASHADEAALLGGSSAADVLDGLIPAGMIGMFASACPSGWTLCNGSGACPNLVGAYVKGGSSFAAQAGSNSHTHGAGSYFSQFIWDGDRLYANLQSASWTGNWTTTTGVGPSQAATFTQTSGAMVGGTSASASHEPIHATLVLCMKN